MATIGIDATALSTKASGGIGTSQYQTMRALAALDCPHRFLLYAATPPVTPFTGAPLDLPWPVRLGSGALARSNTLWGQTVLGRRRVEDQVEVFWGPRHLLPRRAPGVAMVATSHDFWHRYFPAQQPPLNRWADRVLIDRVLRQADVLIAPSEATARDAMRFSPQTAGKIRVIPWGVDERVFRPRQREETEALLTRLGAVAPYVVSLDVFNPRKDFTTVLNATARLNEPPGDALTGVGLGRPRGGSALVGVETQVRRLALQERVVLPGDLTCEELACLYSGATALCYPSLYEGFGMPILEAMACGCPVITADNSSLPSVAGDAALLMEARDVDRLTRYMTLLSENGDERARLAVAGLARARLFTWKATAEGMLTAFEEALALQRRSA